MTEIIYKPFNGLEIIHYDTTDEVMIYNTNNDESELLAQDTDETNKVILILQAISGKDLDFLKEMKEKLESNDPIRREDVVGMLGDWIDQIEEIKQ